MIDTVSRNAIKDMALEQIGSRGKNIADDIVKVCGNMSDANMKLLYTLCLFLIHNCVSKHIDEINKIIKDNTQNGFTENTAVNIYNEFKNHFTSNDGDDKRKLLQNLEDTHNTIYKTVEITDEEVTNDTNTKNNPSDNTEKEICFGIDEEWYTEEENENEPLTEDEDIFLDDFLNNVDEESPEEESDEQITEEQTSEEAEENSGINLPATTTNGVPTVKEEAPAPKKHIPLYYLLGRFEEEFKNKEGGEEFKNNTNIENQDVTEENKEDTISFKNNDEKINNTVKVTYNNKKENDKISFNTNKFVITHKEDSKIDERISKNTILATLDYMENKLAGTDKKFVFTINTKTDDVLSDDFLKNMIKQFKKINNEENKAKLSLISKFRINGMDVEKDAILNKDDENLTIVKIDVIKELINGAEELKNKTEGLENKTSDSGITPEELNALFSLNNNQNDI